MKILVSLSKALGPVTTIAEGAGKALGDVIIKAVDAVFDCCDTYKVDKHKNQKLMKIFIDPYTKPTVAGEILSTIEKTVSIFFSKKSK